MFMTPLCVTEVGLILGIEERHRHRGGIGIEEQHRHRGRHRKPHWHQRRYWHRYQLCRRLRACVGIIIIDKSAGLTFDD